jgi:ABC-2 type transport system ATP-binding protein
MSVLQVENISKSYGELKAVQNVSFQVEPGRIYGILGPNGAGKTTTIRMVMNILIPDSGQIKLFGQRMNDDLKKRIGYLPEERGLYTKMKVLDILTFFGELHEMDHQNALEQTKKWLKRMELLDWKDKKVEELSKGMQQKIQFIATIMHEPDLLILDEPFAGLDPINTQLIKNIMLEFSENNTAIMFSTHLLDAAERICHDVLLINKGKKVLDGNLNSIKREYGDNSLQIEYDGDGEFIKSLPMVEKYEDYGNYAEVNLKNQDSSQELLKALIDKIEIRRFQTAESSLNDIFISIVKGKK